MVPRAVLTLGLFVLASSAGAQVGHVLRRQAIDGSTGGFTGVLTRGDSFGAAMASLGDLNGDGVVDLAVGAPGTDSVGAIWILFLRPDGTVLSQTKIGQTQGGFTGLLNVGGALGARLDSVGDLDGDGIPELAVYSGRPSRFWIVFLRSDGTVKNQTENRYTDPVFGGQTSASHFNGPWGVGGLEALGDLDGDGLGDLAVGSPYDPDGAGLWTGAIWIVRLKADGTLKAAHKISQTQGGFAGGLQSLDLFGYTIAHLGDLDGDGNRELGVKARGGDFWVLNLDANERVTNQRSFGGPTCEYYCPYENFAWLGDLDGDGSGEVAMDGLAIASLHPDGRMKRLIGNPPHFARRLEPLGDLDGDGNPEVAAGIGFLGDNGIEIVTLDPRAVRNGSGVNPLTLSQAAEPVLGTTWSITLDCSGHASSLAAVWGFSAPAASSFTSFGEVLVTGNRLFYLRSPHASAPTPFQLSVPGSIQLFGLPMYVQGACAGAPGVRLSNALDVLIGQ